MRRGRAARPGAASQTRAAQRPPRATRWISALTSRSTMLGRFSSSQVFSSGRRISRAAFSASSELCSARLVESASNAAETASSAWSESSGGALFLRRRRAARVRARARLRRGFGGRGHRLRQRLAPHDFRRRRFGRRRRFDGARRRRRVLGIDDLRPAGGRIRLRRRSRHGGLAVVGDDRADRGEDLFHRRLVGALGAAQRVEVAFARGGIGCVHCFRLRAVRRDVEPPDRRSNILGSDKGERLAPRKQDHDASQHGEITRRRVLFTCRPACARPTACSSPGRNGPADRIPARRGRASGSTTARPPTAGCTN